MYLMPRISSALVLFFVIALPKNLLDGFKIGIKFDKNFATPTEAANLGAI